MIGWKELPSQRRYLIWIALVGLLCRLIMLGVNYNNLEMDGSFVIHGEIARNILLGNGIVVNAQNAESILHAWRSEKKLIDLEDLPAPTENKLVAEYIDEPGYGILLAGLWKIFGSKRWIFVRILQILIDVWMIILVFYIGRQLSTKQVALVAAFLYAVFLPGIELVVRPHRDIWVTFVYICSVAALLRVSKTTNIRSEILLVIGLGLSIGCTAWMRSTVVAYGVACVAALWAWKTRVRAVALSGILLLSFVVVIGPLAKRNYDTFGRLMITRGAFWHSFWAGIGQFSNPAGMIEDDGYIESYFFVRDSTAVYGTPRYEEVLKKKGLEFVSDHPVWYAGSVLRRAGVILSPKIGRQLFFQKTSIRSDTGILNRRIGAFLLLFADGVMVVGMFWGLWVLRSKRKILLIVTLPLLYTLVTLSPFYVVGRNIMNIYFVTLLLASVPIVWCANRLMGTMGWIGFASSVGQNDSD